MTTAPRSIWPAHLIPRRSKAAIWKSPTPTSGSRRTSKLSWHRSLPPIRGLSNISAPNWMSNLTPETHHRPQPGRLNTMPRVKLADVDPAISLGPLDGRYRKAVAPLVDHLSEAALNRERIHVEVEWLIHLASSGAVPGVAPLTDAGCGYLRGIVTDFGPEQIAELADIERETVHDVKAVEYFIQRRLNSAAAEVGAASKLPELTELVHFACTSEDINNLSYARMVRDAGHNRWVVAERKLREQLVEMAREYAEIPLLSRTHGQAATPSTLGKELGVLAFRLGRQLKRIENTEILGKINGATGTYGAHVAAVPETNWPEISRTFVEHLGLTWNPLTTQIESHDWQAESYAAVARFNPVRRRPTTGAGPD